MKSSNLIPKRILFALELSLCFFTFFHSTLQPKASSPAISLDSCTYSENNSTICITGTLQTDSTIIYASVWNDQNDLVAFLTTPVEQQKFSFTTLNKTLTSGIYNIHLSDYRSEEAISTSISITSEYDPNDSSSLTSTTSTSAQTLLLLSQLLPTMPEDNHTAQVIDITLQDDTYIPELIFQIIQAKPITIHFILKNGTYWSITGTDIQTDPNDYIDLDMRTDESYLPMDTVELLFPNTQKIPLHLSASSISNFSRTLYLNAGQEYSGYFGKLYYYDPDANSFQFQDANIIQDDGTLSLRFQHASDYIIVIESTFLTSASQITSISDSSMTALDSVPSTGESYFPKNILLHGICSLFLTIFLLSFIFPKENEKSPNMETQKKTDD